MAGSLAIEMPAIRSYQLNDPETFCQGDEHASVVPNGRAEYCAAVRLATVKKSVANERRNSASTVEPASRARR